MCNKSSKVSKSGCNCHGKDEGCGSCYDSCAKSCSRYVRRPSLVNKPLLECRETRKKCCRRRRRCCHKCKDECDECDDEDDEEGA
jgi:hypothetical protein